MPDKPNILITGAAGYIGSVVCRQLAADRDKFGAVIGLDVKTPLPDRKLNNISYLIDDIRSEQLHIYLQKYAIDVVVHLAAIVSPPKSMSRAELHDIEVNGTQNLLHKCAQTGVKKIIYTSSGAAYGYHADNPEVIDESVPLRGNPEFAYSDHKRQIETLFAEYRKTHPQLQQLIQNLKPLPLVVER